MAVAAVTALRLLHDWEGLVVEKSVIDSDIPMTAAAANAAIN